ncbi:unnamed protein product [Phytophthora fragariaefolia]|uniref:Unnamed protein product n=1 Tax=Phytophthora fragariaefolia TaxID=1490495 RepID=A0A9W6XUW6_9STRA|nr:unnamed protein product [Phytophthora fragariaefolia]
MQAQERYSLARGTPDTQATKSERALITPASDVTALAIEIPAPTTICSYCQMPHYIIRQCRGLQKDLREGTVKEGTLLPASFERRGVNTRRSHPYDNNQGRPSRGHGSWRDRGRGRSGRDNRGEHHAHDIFDHRSQRRDEGGYDQSRRRDALIAVVTTVQTLEPAFSLRTQATTDFDSSWTVDSGCSSHVTQHAEWFKVKAPASGNIYV